MKVTVNQAVKFGFLRPKIEILGVMLICIKKELHM